MKYLFFTIVISAILLSSCGNKANNKSDVHTHEDGSVHTDHDNSSNSAPAQELFDVENDSLPIEGEQESDHSHSHESGHEHNH